MSSFPSAASALTPFIGGTLSRRDDSKVASTIVDKDKVRVVAIEYTDRGGKFDASVPAMAWM